MRQFEGLTQTLYEIFSNEIPPNRGIRQIIAVSRVLRGEAVEVVSAEVRLQRRGLETAVGAVRERGLAGLTSYEARATDQQLRARRLGIAQMLLGLLGEQRFEQLTEEITGSGILSVEDHRPSRTDTDYRLLNGNRSPICRLNIKFHGTLFREARRFVGLEPEDCFALATYKINAALRRQQEERLPYVFLVLSIPDLNAADVGQLVPDDYVWALAVIDEGRMAVEEAIVRRLLAAEHRDQFRPIVERMPEGQFRIISAAKADGLLRANLFERVHALSLKGFTRRFRNAEVDMHLSLSRELTPVRTFLQLLVAESPQKFAVRLYTGEY